MPFPIRLELLPAALLLVPAIAIAAIGDTLISMPAPGSFPAGLAFHGESLWLADWEEGLLYELDPETGAMLQSVKAPCHHPDGLASDGELLYISPKTVDVHRTNIMKKLDIHSIVQLVKYAIQQGLVEI